ncbi:MAG: Hint domain-containing protein, partial [Bacilli bacterium]|nr:Hint domain-containing protein [Bacilli bacterium]
TILSNVTIINNGTITVGGSIGYGGSAQRLTGQVASSYCEILMQDGSKISNNGTLNIYGYIKENSKNNNSVIDNFSGSSVTMPLVIYDFRGGSYSKACANDNIMPFSTFDLPNCQVYQKFSYGSILKGMVTIYASMWATDEVSILAPDTATTALFKQSSGFVGIKYTPANCLYTTNDLSTSTVENTSNITNIYINGSVSLSSMTLNIGTNINTANFDCPICYKFRITIESGNLNVNNKMKFLGGAEVIINQGSSASINASTSFYQNYIPPIKYSSGVVYPSVFHTAKLINNGTLNINSNFGGLVDTSLANAKLITGSGFSGSYSTTEALNISGSSIFASVSETDVHTEDALAYMGATSKPSSPSVLSSSLNLDSKGDYWYLPLSDITSVQISPSSGASGANAEGVFKLNASVLPVENSSTNISYTWTCDRGNNYLSSTTGQSVTLTTPANSGSSNINYTVTCTATFTKNDGTDGNVSISGTYTATKKNSCVTGDTLISLSDGSFKQIKDITYDDNIIAFDHVTGQKVKTSAAIIFVHDEVECQKLTLRFSDGTCVNVLDNHEFFDLSLNKYVEINELTYQSYIGHQFAKIIGDTGLTDYNSVILNSVNITNTYEKSYSIQSAVNINFITNTMLSRTVPAYEGWFDYFDFGDPLIYDPIKMNEDITNYGLYDYSDFEYLGITEEQFIAFNGPYLKVLVGKGVVTFDDIIELISRYVI